MPALRVERLSTDASASGSASLQIQRLLLADDVKCGCQDYLTTMVMDGLGPLVAATDWPRVMQ